MKRILCIIVMFLDVPCLHSTPQHEAKRKEFNENLAILQPLVTLERNGQHVCSGSLISGYVVITAGHCFEEDFMVGSNPVWCSAWDCFGSMDPLDYVAVMNIDGDTEVSTDSTDLLIPILSIYKYNDTNNRTYDVALLFVSYFAVIGINTIKLAPDGQEFVGSICRAGGVVNSTIKEKHADVTSTVVSTQGTVLSTSDCRDYLKDIQPENVCFRNSNIKPCIRDTGSPLMCDGRLVGVTTAWDSEKCSVEYVNVANSDVNKWINQYLP